MIALRAKIGNSHNNVFYLHIVIPKKIVEQFDFDGKAKRILCSINKHEPFYCAFMPKGDGDFFININKQIIKTHQIAEGSEVDIEIKKDTSKYGMPMSEEFEVALAQDEMATELFENLTPGKKRNLLHIVNKVKSSDIRIKKSLVIMAHLCETEGELDFKLLNQRFKEANQR